MTPIAKYIKTGEKPCQKNIGLEIEHFILNDQTGEPMPYENMLHLLETLKDRYDEAVVEEGHLIALESETTLLTLEPGCQLELSFANTADLYAIRSWYQEAIEPIRQYVEARGYSIVYSGGIPTMDVDRIHRIPKERYRLMEAWFETAGTRGKEMMKGSASIHISIDFENEADFIKKYQMANFLHPFFNFITSNSKYYEGKINEDVLLRSAIWEATDPVRTGYMPYTFSHTLGYEAYAQFVDTVPLIVVAGQRGIYGSEKTAVQVAEEEGWSDSMIAHYLSMVFPFVRVKKFIEIRSADSMPEEEMMAYCALIKGLFYAPSNVDYYAKLACHQTIEGMKRIETILRKDRWDGWVMEESVQTFLLAMVERAEEVLDEKDRLLLDPLKKRVIERQFVFEKES